MVIYFSGTGNSKYIAELMAKRLGDSAADAALSIKTGEHPSFASEKPYIFVAPVYAWRLPRVFRDWIEKCGFSGNKKAYFVLTCGDDIGAAGSYIENLAEKSGFEYMGTAAVIMPENYLVMFDPTPEEEDEGIIISAAEHTARLCDKIIAERPFDKTKPSLLGHLESGIVNSSFYFFYIGARKFYATDACISCGKCVKDCMLNNIRLSDGKPKWGKDCTHCMACICGCPTEAIEYGKSTKGRRRYTFKYREQ